MASLKSFTFRDGQLRLYDATATPFYIEIPFIQANFTAPMMRPRPEEMNILDRGRMKNSNAFWHTILGPDDPIAAPLPLTFSFRLVNTDPGWKKWRQALNLDFASTWTVGSNTWVSAKGTTQVLSGGPEVPTLVTTPLFSDLRKRCVNVCVLWADPDGISDLGYKWSEVYFPPDQQQLNEGNDIVEVRASGQIYGAIVEITAFPSGTAG